MFPEWKDLGRHPIQLLVVAHVVLCDLVDGGTERWKADQGIDQQHGMLDSVFSDHGVVVSEELGRSLEEHLSTINEKSPSAFAEGFSVWVGGDLLSHVSPQYHRHCRA